MKPFFNLHTHHFTDNSDILELTNQYPNDFDESIPFYSIGIHPWYIVDNEIDNYLKIIESKLKLDNCLALGECGLDKRIDYPFDKQVAVFEKQLLLSKKYNKPIILHCVGAFQEIIEIKKRLKITQPMIIHGFSKNIETAKQLLDNGFYLSFGKYLLLSQSLGTELKTVFNQIPNDQFFLETDTISESLQDVYKLAADYKNISISELQEIININVKTVFKI